MRKHPPKKLAKSPPEKNGVSETIISIQSVFLLLFGIAGMMATGTIVAGFKAMRDLDSAVTLITDGAVVTDKTTISVERVEGIINNFELVCLTSLTIGIVVAVATVARLILKSKKSSHGSSTTASASSIAKPDRLLPVKKGRR
jgi:hypothetical protein